MDGIIKSWGTEIEWGDIPRTVPIPESLGAWEYHEVDIVNQRPPYWGIAVDPLGCNPPMGGEINTMPTRTRRGQLQIVDKLKTYFRGFGAVPTVSCRSDLHIHVHIPGLKHDLNKLKKLLTYIAVNQNDFIKATYPFYFDPRMTETFTAPHYLTDDCGRPTSTKKIEFLLRCPSLRNFWDLYTEKQDPSIPSESSRRDAINLTTLLVMDTIEFRCFRATTEINEFSDSYKICDKFITAAFGEQTSIKTIINTGEYNFPQFYYDHELWLSWEKTRHPYRGVLKPRKFIDLHEGD
jgi:hypothetical protein